MLIFIEAESESRRLSDETEILPNGTHKVRLKDGQKFLWKPKKNGSQLTIIKFYHEALISKMHIAKAS